MGSVLLSHFMTFDGVVESPWEWMPDYVSEAELAVTADRMESSTAMLLGRRTYAEYAEYWPTQTSDVPLADQTNAMRKYVVGRPPQLPVWSGTTFLEGEEPIEAVRRLVDAGEVLMVTGSVRLSRALLAAGVVDELYLTVAPLIRGHGQRLFPDDGPATQLRPLHRRDLPHGAEYAAYRVLTEERA